MRKARYRRIVFFFLRVIASLIVWELLLPWLGFRKVTGRTRSRRLRRIATAYRRLAVRMGGVLIKVGQFLSARADVLPDEITSELSGLQDEVPPEDFEAIRRLAEAELGAPLSEKYADFEEVPLAAASLGQVHRAKLPLEETTNFGADVVVKIQRPDIETIIATDLAALRTVGSWLMRYRPIRRRADVPALLAEFTRILYEEIDYLAEGRNADTFAETWNEVPGVRVPAVVWTHTTRRTLTLEDVYAIKITDYQEITAAGVDRSQVAKRVFDVYLRQIFEDGFFHADPHPGNLFVNPLKDADNGDQPWELTFVDFGMAGRVPSNTRAGLRELAIALATRNPERLVKSYQMLNVLLPHADLSLLTRAEAIAFDRFWGKSMEELREISFQEMHDFAVEFREIVFTMPFQVPQDLVFLFRTVAILAGICTGLDPAFNFWESITPYATKLMTEGGESRWDFILDEAQTYLQTLFILPQRFESALTELERGRISVRVPEIGVQSTRLVRAIRQVAAAVVFWALLNNGVQLYLSKEFVFAYFLFTGAFIALVSLLLPRNWHS